MSSFNENHSITSLNKQNFISLKGFSFPKIEKQQQANLFLIYLDYEDHHSSLTTTEHLSTAFNCPEEDDDDDDDEDDDVEDEDDDVDNEDGIDADGDKRVGTVSEGNGDRS